MFFTIFQFPPIFFTLFSEFCTFSNPFRFSNHFIFGLPNLRLAFLFSLTLSWRVYGCTSFIFSFLYLISSSALFEIVTPRSSFSKVHRSINKFPAFGKRWCHQYVMVKIVCSKTSYRRIGHLVTT